MRRASETFMPAVRVDPGYRLRSTDASEDDQHAQVSTIPCGLVLEGGRARLPPQMVGVREDPDYQMPRRKRRRVSEAEADEPDECIVDIVSSIRCSILPRPPPMPTVINVETPAEIRQRLPPAPLPPRPDSSEPSSSSATQRRGVVSRRSQLAAASASTAAQSTGSRGVTPRRARTSHSDAKPPTSPTSDRITRADLDRNH